MRAGFTLLGAAALIAIAGACDTRPRAPAPAPVPERTVETIRRDGNHLVGQPSPYLEQHAHNPVDWYPWGPEALDRARRERRLIFVSVGYATCHWCHVMEKETFEDDDTARLLNARFVAIKIDREERPDLDALFVEAVTRLGESAGWPLNLILTPDLEPVFGGTYFPRVATGGRPGLSDVLREFDQRFHDDGPALARRGKDLLAELNAEASAKAPDGRPRRGRDPRRHGRARPGTRFGRGRVRLAAEVPRHAAPLRRAALDGAHALGLRRAEPPRAHPRPDAAGRDPRPPLGHLPPLRGRPRAGTSPTSRRPSTTTPSSPRSTSKPPARSRTRRSNGWDARSSTISWHRGSAPTAG